MYIQKYKCRGIEYLRVMETVRVPGQKHPKQKIIKNYGNLEKALKANPNIIEELEEKVRIYNENKLIKKIDKTTDELIKITNLKDIKKGKTGEVNYGVDIYKYLWKELKLDKFLKNILSNTRIKYPLEEIMQIHVIDRLLNQNSNIKKYENNKMYTLQSFYKSLSKISTLKEEIQLHLHKEILNIKNRELSVCFYDVTTYYFESQKSNEILNFGYSKDNKLNQVQVVMGLLIDNDGIPISYELFSGNTNEFSTLEPILLNLKEKYNVKNIVITADRGLNSKSNLLKIKEMGFDYVMAYKIKSANKQLEEKIFNEKGYKKITDNYLVKEESIKQEIKVDNKKYTLEDKLVITYSEKRAQKDKKDRERLIQKAIKLQEKASSVKSELKKGGKKYLSINIDDKDIALNEDSIKKDAKYDGFYAIITSKKDLNNEDILDTYSRLWKIEESFRVLKTNLKTRPTFVYSESSIRGHFLVCFIALVIERVLEYKLKTNGVNYSTKLIQDTIRKAVFWKIKIDEIEYMVKTTPTKELEEILKTLNLKDIEDFKKVDKRIKSYLQYI